MRERTKNPMERMLPKIEYQSEIARLESALAEEKKAREEAEEKEAETYKKWVKAVAKSDTLRTRTESAESRVAQLEEALQSVVDYFKPQGTGRVFHLGYGGDKQREESLHKALTSSPSAAAEVLRVVEKLIDAHTVDWDSLITELETTYQKYKEKK